MNNEENLTPPQISLIQIYQLEKATKDKILEKYEEILFERENQIRELSYQMGLLNEKLYNVYYQYILLKQSCEKLKQIAHDKEELENKINKKDNHLQQEIENKEIMFNKLNVLVNENDKLKKIIQNSSTDVSLLSDNNHHHKRGHSLDKNKIEKSETFPHKSNNNNDS